MKIFDTHAHYNLSNYNNDLYSCLDDCLKNNVDKICLISSSINDSISELNLCIELNKKYKNKIIFYLALGIHPDEILVDDYNNMIDFHNEYDKLLNLIDDTYKNYNNIFVAIGEIGLDYYNKNLNENLINSQKKYFIEQIKISKKYNLPIVIHSRDAYNDTLNIINEYILNEKAVLHCFSYNCDFIKSIKNENIYIGVGGVLTFKNGQKSKEVVKDLPIERIIVETDSPFLSPEPFRGKRNNSSNIQYVLKAISDIKNIDIEDVSNIIYNNSCLFYNIK